MNAQRRHRYGVDRLTGSAGTISGEVHRRMARSGGAPPWQARLTAEQRADFRRWGQRTFNLVLEYVAAGKRAERTLLLGGQLTCLSQPGDGTRLLASVPLPLDGAHP